MEQAKLTKQQTGTVEVSEVPVEDVRNAHAYPCGDRLIIVIGDKAYALPREVASVLAWDTVRGLQQIQG